MTTKKPRVIAFYHTSPTLSQMAEELETHTRNLNEQLDFLSKRYREIQKEGRAQAVQIFEKIGAEIDRLGLCPDEKFEKQHFHVDFETKTFQRCNGHHGIDIGTLLGFE